MKPVLLHRITKRSIYAMSNENESILQVPISDEAKAILQERATANGRAMGREAQQILNRTLLKDKKNV